MKRLFIDMDGVLAVFKKVEKLETLHEKNYFLNLSPMEKVINTAKLIIKSNTAEVYILSSVLMSSPYALNEKNKWLDQYFNIPKERRIFVPCGQRKHKSVPNFLQHGEDYLLDDYTKNLLEFESAGGIGIKLLNGINHTNKTWNGHMISVEDTSYDMYQNIMKYIIEEKQNIINEEEIKVML